MPMNSTTDDRCVSHTMDGPMAMSVNPGSHVHPTWMTFTDIKLSRSSYIQQSSYGFISIKSTKTESTIFAVRH